MVRCFEEKGNAFMSQSSKKWRLICEGSELILLVGPWFLVGWKEEVCDAHSSLIVLTDLFVPLLVPEGPEHDTDQKPGKVTPL